MQTHSSTFRPNFPGSSAGSRGFTLVELLVVIGIIALLLGILLPTLGRVRAQAAETKCMSNIRQWAQAMQMYVSETQGTLPLPGEDGDRANEPVGYWQEPGLWFNALPRLAGSKAYFELQEEALAGGTRLPLEGDNSLFVCPATTIAIRSGGDASNAVSPEGYFVLYGREPGTAPTSQGTPRNTFICYVLNSKINDYVQDASTGTVRNRPVVKMSQLRPASQVAMIVEKRMQPNEVTSSNRSRSLARMKADWQRFSGRHRKGGMIAFADGHVDWFLETEVQPEINPYNGTIRGNDKVIWSPLIPGF